MSEVFRPYDDSEEKAPLKEKETDAVETEEKIQRTFIDMMLIVRTELQEAGYTLRRETTDSKAGTEFKGRSTEDVKDDTREKGERRIEGILKKLAEKEKGFLNENLENLGENAPLLSFEQLSNLFELISNIILELDPASALKQTLQLLLQNIKAAMQMKAGK